MNILSEFYYKYYLYHINVMVHLKGYNKGLKFKCLKNQAVNNQTSWGLQ